MILNIENYTIKIDYEARTVEVSQDTLDMTPTPTPETLMEAVERVQEPTPDEVATQAYTDVDMWLRNRTEISEEDLEEMSRHFQYANLNDLIETDPRCEHGYFIHLSECGYCKWPQAEDNEKHCRNCEATETPQWRDSLNPLGPLCNACGVRQYRNGRGPDLTKRATSISSCCGTIGRKMRNGSCKACRPTLRPINAPRWTRVIPINRRG